MLRLSSRGADSTRGLVRRPATAQRRGGPRPPPLAPPSELLARLSLLATGPTQSSPYHPGVQAQHLPSNHIPLHWYGQVSSFAGPNGCDLGSKRALKMWPPHPVFGLWPRIRLFCTSFAPLFSAPHALHAGCGGRFPLLLTLSFGERSNCTSSITFERLKRLKINP